MIYYKKKYSVLKFADFRIDDSLYQIRNNVWVADRCFKTIVDYAAENPKDDIEYEKISKDCKFRLIVSLFDHTNLDFFKK